MDDRPSIPDRAGIFSPFANRSRPALYTISWGIKLTRAEVNNAFGFICTPLHVFMAQCTSLFLLQCEFHLAALDSHVPLKASLSSEGIVLFCCSRDKPWQSNWFNRRSTVPPAVRSLARTAFFSSDLGNITGPPQHRGCRLHCCTKDKAKGVWTKTMERGRDTRPGNFHC
jgi:hypothetical protein